MVYLSIQRGATTTGGVTTTRDSTFVDLREHTEEVREWFICQYTGPYANFKQIMHILHIFYILYKYIHPEYDKNYQFVRAQPCYTTTMMSVGNCAKTKINLPQNPV